MIKLKRAYEDFQNTDGFRILVDRLWPRGLTKEKAHIDLWAKDISPTTDLRKWFNHDGSKWQQFLKSYTEELHHNERIDELLQLIAGRKEVSLIYGAKDQQHNEAVVLLNFINNAIKDR